MVAIGNNRTLLITQNAVSDKEKQTWKDIACVQPPLPSKQSERSSFPIFLREGAAVHRLGRTQEISETDLISRIAFILMYSKSV